MERHRSINKTAAAALPSLLLGTAAGVSLSAALLALTAMIFVKLETPPINAAPFITAGAGAIGSFIAGMLTLKLCGSRGLLMGSLAGLLTFCCVLAGGSTWGEVSLSPALIRCTVFIACGAAGGIFQVNKRIKVPKKL